MCVSVCHKCINSRIHTANLRRSHEEERESRKRKPKKKLVTTTKRRKNKTQRQPANYIHTPTHKGSAIPFLFPRQHYSPCAVRCCGKPPFVTCTEEGVGAHHRILPTSGISAPFSEQKKDLSLFFPHKKEKKMTRPNSISKVTERRTKQRTHTHTSHERSRVSRPMAKEAKYNTVLLNV